MLLFTKNHYKDMMMKGSSAGSQREAGHGDKGLLLGRVEYRKSFFFSVNVKCVFLSAASLKFCFYAFIK